MKKVNSLLKNSTISKLSIFQKQNCEDVLNEKEIFESIKSFRNNKSPGNDSLTKRFFMPSGMKLSNHF